ncbi:MAG: hypothetical protein FWE96_03540 [Coriobacteriia bacterium]|nr:hypothetical protein [Coriobacteriia bacterium]
MEQRDGVSVPIWSVWNRVEQRDGVSVPIWSVWNRGTGLVYQFGLCGTEGRG